MNVKNVTLIIATKDNDLPMAKFYTEVLGFTLNASGGYQKGNLAVYFDRHNQANLKGPRTFPLHDHP